ncbi:MAG: two-component regulator propeller domain-containing protein [Flavobacteriaceae bacterium]
MKKYLFFCFFFIYSLLNAQIDFSNEWEDFYSYNNVKDFLVENNVIYAITDNAVFSYDISTKEIRKLSSVEGLSGETTSAIYYSKSNKKLVIGYETGLVEVIDENGKITISADIVSFNQSGDKRINHIFEFNNKLYLSTPFAVVVYDIKKLEFGDTYFIGNGSTEEHINQILIENNIIFAATKNGIYSADVTKTNLVDFNLWNRKFTGEFTNLVTFNNKIYTTKHTFLYSINGSNLTLERDFLQTIKSLKSSTDHLTLGLNKSVKVLDTSLNQIVEYVINTDFDFNINNAQTENSNSYLATKEFGILKTNFSSPTTYEEIHPEGPLNNDVFSITAKQNNVWLVYGGYTTTFAPIQRRLGFSHYNGKNWKNTKYSSSLPFPDLVHVSIDPNNVNKVYIGSFGDTSNPNLVNTINTGGLFVVEYDVITHFYNHKNSDLEDIVPLETNRATIRISSSAFDTNGNLWMTNVGTTKELKKFSSNGLWSGFDISSTKTVNGFGLTELAVDNVNNIWIGSRKDGAIVFNENGNRKLALTTRATKGSLPSENVRTIAVDKNNRIWIGTLTGLVVFNNASGIFDATTYDAEPIIILDDGIPKKLLGDQRINSIVVDGADNKWFGTNNSGVLYTNPNGQTTIANFNKDNSPLPSNKIVKISVDDITGKVYFATDKGVVAYNSKVAPFGNELKEVYAYPNPVLKQHSFVTIDGRNGTHLPKGTNVKILDVAGNLVYETNVVEGQELKGGKVVWNKKNLAGRKVASGVYLVLLTTEDGSESTTTKIAIIN